jgi:hypothetical protein
VHFPEAVKLTMQEKLIPSASSLALTPPWLFGEAVQSAHPGQLSVMPQIVSEAGVSPLHAFPENGTRPQRPRTPQGEREHPAGSGRTSFAVWLDVHTGEGRLRRRRD